jgi:hypothetical protein
MDKNEILVAAKQAAPNRANWKELYGQKCGGGSSGYYHVLQFRYNGEQLLLVQWEEKSIGSYGGHCSWHIAREWQMERTPFINSNGRIHSVPLEPEVSGLGVAVPLPLE